MRLGRHSRPDLGRGLPLSDLYCKLRVMTPHQPQNSIWTCFLPLYFSFFAVELVGPIFVASSVMAWFASEVLTKARNLIPLRQARPISTHCADAQNLSPLYRLPSELRQKIWIAYFAAHTVHIYQSDTDDRLHADECSNQDPDDDSVITYGPHYGTCRSGRSPCNRLSSILTCKRV